jgi:hypothetical protein
MAFLRRAWLRPVALGALGMAGLAGCGATGRTGSGADAGREPLLVLTGVRAEVMEGPVIKERVNASSARMDDVNKTLQLRDMTVVFYDEGTKKGEAFAGKGTLWMQDDPEKGIARNDMALESPVRYASVDGMLLESPAMRYRNDQDLLESQSGFVKQVPSESGYIVAEGQRIELKLRAETAEFEWWKEFGNPLVYRQTEEPVLKP